MKTDVGEQRPVEGAIYRWFRCDSFGHVWYEPLVSLTPFTIYCNPCRLPDDLDNADDLAGPCGGYQADTEIVAHGWRV
jgi:hypothetical protein